MELEHRVEALEREIADLKQDIRGTLLDVQKCLSEKPLSPSQWRKRAWVLALLNVLLAITLFTNIRVYAPAAPSESSSPWEAVLRESWIGIAFVWLIFQIYPLALLLDHENAQIRRIAWRNAITLILSSPGLIAALTAMVLLTAVISKLLPSLWFVIVGALVVIACFNLVGHLRHRGQARSNKET